MNRRRSTRRRGPVLPPGTYATLKAMREREEERKRREAEQVNESQAGHPQHGR